MTAVPPTLAVALLASLGTLAGCAGYRVMPMQGTIPAGAAPPAGVFAYTPAPLQPEPLDEPEIVDRRYTVQRIAFSAPAQGRASARQVYVRHFRGRAPGPRPVLIVVPIWGPGLYSYPSAGISGSARARSRGEFDVLEIEGQPSLVDWGGLSSAPTPEAFAARAEALVDGSRQAVITIRRMLDWIEAEPDLAVDATAIVGFSMGAVVAAMALGADDRFAAGVVVMGAAHLADVFANCKGRTGGIRTSITGRFGWSDDQYRALFERLFSEADPASGRLRYDASRLLVIDARYDDCVPLRSREGLWEALGRPQRITYFAQHRAAFLSMTPLSLRHANRRIYGFIEPRLREAVATDPR